jgi:hypothetical protein
MSWFFCVLCQALCSHYNCQICSCSFWWYELRVSAREGNPTTAAQIDLFMSQKPREDVKLFKNWQTRNGTQSNLIQPVLPSNKLTKFRCSLQTMPSSAHKQLNLTIWTLSQHDASPNHSNSSNCLFVIIYMYIYIYIYMYIYLYIYIYIFAP